MYKVSTSIKEKKHKNSRCLMFHFTKSKTFILAMVIAAVALGNSGSTLYLPGMPQIRNDLNINNTEVKLTLSLFLVCYALSQIFYGPLSDSFGRKKCLLVGLFIFCIGSALSALSSNFTIFLIGRALEGIGIGSATSVGYAILRDIFSSKDLVVRSSYISTFVGLSLLISPLVGGYLVEYLGWRACFVVLFFFSLLLFTLMLCKLPETNLTPNPQAYLPSVVRKNYFFLLRQPIFLGFILVVGMGGAILFSANAMMPFIIIDCIGTSSSTYGLLMMITGGGYFIGCLFGGRFGACIGAFRTVLIGIMLCLIGTVIGFLLGLKWINITVILAPLFLVFFGLGFVIPVGKSGAMNPFPKIAGSEAALLGASMYLVAAFFVSITAHIDLKDQIPMMLFLFLESLFILFAILVTKLRKKEKRST